MYWIPSIDQHPEARKPRIDVGRALAVVVTIGLALVISVSLAVAWAVRAGIRPVDRAGCPAHPGDTQRPESDLCLYSETPTARLLLARLG